MEKRGFSPGEVAQILGVSRTTIYREMKKGRLTSVKVANRRIITQHDLENYLGRERTLALFRNQE
ncbi:MAG: helix-turn-helix domain-containing protein [Limnochordia bacterium]|jgi:excisionase family DNA binding protein